MGFRELERAFPHEKDPIRAVRDEVMQPSKGS